MSRTRRFEWLQKHVEEMIDENFNSFLEGPLGLPIVMEEIFVTDKFQRVYHCGTTGMLLSSLW